MRAGGPIIALAGLVEAQVALGLKVSVCATWREGDDRALAEQMSLAGAQVELVGPASRRLLRHRQLKPKLTEMVRASDIVHVHALWEEIQHGAARVAQRQGVPYIMRPCGMLDPWSLRQSWLLKRMYMLLRLRRNLNRAAAIHYTSDVARELAAPLNIKAPTIVEPNGVKLEEFATLPPPGTFRARYPQLEGRPTLTFLGRLHSKKGLELLIPAMARLADLSVMLVIAGPDSRGYEAKLRRLAERHKIADRIVFAGMLRGPERVAALVDADLFVLPSYQENFGNAVVEALAAGRPVVISDQVNIYRQVLQAGVGGVTKQDVDALAAELNRWLSDDSLRAAAAGRARAFVAENYDWKKIAQRWVEHYARIIG